MRWVWSSPYSSGAIMGFFCHTIAASSSSRHWRWCWSCRWTCRSRGRVSSARNGRNGGGSAIMWCRLSSPSTSPLPPRGWLTMVPVANHNNSSGLLHLSLLE